MMELMDGSRTRFEASCYCAVRLEEWKAVIDDQNEVKQVGDVETDYTSKVCVYYALGCFERYFLG